MASASLLTLRAVLPITTTSVRLHAHIFDVVRAHRRLRCSVKVFTLDKYQRLFRRRKVVLAGVTA
ncbi:hypothetical protein KCP76_19940 [Salmonella enterica subsp. enterica serovar Weltevreden]|nr:hypothetical protein KCP76_19940 [Salmonella enterica subsp. enterica serovar Weltevreden]